MFNNNFNFSDVFFFLINKTYVFSCFFFQAEDGIRDGTVTGVQTCALPIFGERAEARGLLGDHTDTDERDVHRLRRLEDRPDLRIAEEPPSFPLDLTERQEMLHGE